MQYVMCMDMYAHTSKMAFTASSSSSGPTSLQTHTQSDVLQWTRQYAPACMWILVLFYMRAYPYIMDTILYTLTHSLTHLLSLSSSWNWDFVIPSDSRPLEYLALNTAWYPIIVWRRTWCSSLHDVCMYVCACVYVCVRETEREEYIKNRNKYT